MKNTKRKLKLKKEIKIILFIVISLIIIFNINNFLIDVKSVNDWRYNQLILIASYIIYGIMFTFTFIKD